MEGYSEQIQVGHSVYYNSLGAQSKKDVYTT